MINIKNIIGLFILVSNVLLALPAFSTYELKGNPDNSDECVHQAIALIKTNYPSLDDTDFNFDKIKDIFEDFTKSSSHLNFEKSFKGMYLALQGIIGHLNKSTMITELGFECKNNNDGCMTALMKLYLYPVYSLARDQQIYQNIHFEPFGEELPDSPLPVIQHCARKAPLNRALITDNVVDCIGIYAFNDEMGAFAHYDMNCKKKDLCKFFQDFDETSPIHVVLMTTLFSTQLQDVYDYTKSLKKIETISINVPNRDVFSSIGYSVENEMGPVQFTMSEKRMGDLGSLNITCLGKHIYYGMTNDIKKMSPLVPYPVLEVTSEDLVHLRSSYLIPIQETPTYDTQDETSWGKRTLIYLY